MKNDKTLSRRDFIRTAGLATAGVMLAGASPATALGAVDAMTKKQRDNIAGSNGKVNLACVGIGNRGADIIKALHETGLCNIVALCDVDLDGAHTQQIQAMFPDARRFRDFRGMFDAMARDIDAVSIATPDHSHFPVCMLAMSLGKHVYVEKPMARTFHEVQLLMDAALKRPHLVTQVGNQGHSEANYFQFKTWMEAGIIKDVTEVTAHMNSPRRWHGWDTGITKYPEGEPVPPGMDWDTWLMSAKWHDYSGKYHNGEWRCWYDFGLGALGDWGAHILDTVHEFLELGLPDEVVPLKLTGHNDYFYPGSSTILFRFPRRGSMPAVDITWYDGVDNPPPLPEGYGASEFNPNIPKVAGADLQASALNPGKIIYSKELIFKGSSHGSTLSIIPEDKAREMEPYLPEVPESPSNHFANFLLACRGEEKTRSPFEIHGPLSQVFSLGVIAQRLGEPLQFDRHSRQIINNRFANGMLSWTPPRKGWEEFYKL